MDPGRRHVLKLGAFAVADGLVGCCHTGVPPVVPSQLGPAFVVDPHCHVFNANDLPVAGFIEHFFEGQGWPALAISILRPAILLLQTAGEVAATLGGGGANESDHLMHLLTGQLQANEVAPAFRPSAPDIADALTGVKTNLRSPAALSETDRTAKWMTLESQLRAAYNGDPKVREYLDRDVPDVTVVNGRVSVEGFGALPTFLRRIVGYLLNYIKFLGVGFNSRLTITSELMNDNREVGVFVPMLVDFDNWQSESKALVSPAKQIGPLELLGKLSIAGRLPGGGSGATRKLIHPFVAFDPKREVLEAPGTLETDPPPPTPLLPNSWNTVAAVPEGQGGMAIVHAAISQAGFIGVKIYPPVGFKPYSNEDDPKLDLALMRLYRWCAKYDVPITAHTGPGNRFEPGYADYPAPSLWAGVLARPELKTLRLNLAHFGDRAQIGGHGEYWIDQAIALMEAFPNVYADMSDQSIPVSEDYIAFVKQRFDAHPRCRSRVLYGSDWFMDELEPGSGYSTKDYLPFMRSRMATALYPDTAERFLAYNALTFLGFLDDAGRPNLGNQNFQRLAAFYGDHARPSWLGG